VVGCISRRKVQIKDEKMRIKYILNKAIKVIINKEKFVSALSRRGFFNCLSDKTFLKLVFRNRVGYTLNLRCPTTFNEKLQWLKLYNRDPIYTKMVDKYTAKEYVSEKLGGEYIIPTLGVWNSFDEINFESLPNQFVLKTTHDSGGVIICTDKKTFDFDDARKKFTKRLKKSFFMQSREWPYKNVVPRIIAEEYIEEIGFGSFYEYKMFCFNGKIKMVLVCKGEFLDSERTIDYCDEKFNKLPFISYNQPSKDEVEMPKEKEQLFEIAEKLSKDIPHVRVDMYVVNDKIYFGELTFFHGSGFQAFEPREWDSKIGEWLELPLEKKQQ